MLGRRTYIVEVDSGEKWKRHLAQLKRCYSDRDVSFIPRSTLTDNSPTDSINDNEIFTESVRGDDENITSRVLRRRSQIKKPDRLQID